MGWITIEEGANSSIAFGHVDIEQLLNLSRQEIALLDNSKTLLDLQRYGNEMRMGLENGNPDAFNAARERFENSLGSIDPDATT